MARILIIDDDDLTQSMLKIALDTQGHAVFQAFDGHQGMKLLRAEKFDLVITDIWMPETDGLQVIRQVQQDFPETKILAISGGSHKYPALEALPVARALGAKKLLRKPFGEQELLEAIEALA
jgi:DNA-binding response OmpR family regulator